MAGKRKGPRERVTAIVTGFPEGEAVASGDHLHLMVRNKRYGYFLDDHHGDGRVAINCKTTDAMRLVLETKAPDLFHIPKYVGSRGWIGLWLDASRVDWTLVQAALREAYVATAPKRLVRELEGD